MYCRNCGKNIPDSSKFCPFCGTTVMSDNNEQQVTNSIKQETKPLGNRIQIGNYSYDAKEFLELEKTSKFFKAVFIVTIVSVLIYFASCALIAVFSNGIDDKKQSVIIAQRIFSICVSVYSICYAGLTIASLVMIMKTKKFVHGLKTMIISKTLLIVLLFVFAVLAILNIGNGNNGNAGIFIATIILCGFCFFVSGVNTSIAQSCVVNKKFFDQAREILKRNETK